MVISADIYNNGDERITLTVNGSVVVTDTSATLAFTSASFAGQSVNFDLKFIFEKNVTVPEVPSGALDISTLTMADFETIFEEIQTNSKIAKLFGMQ